jgi:leucyl aminopeptidase
MNFELVSLSRAEVAASKSDALVVLVPDTFKPGKDTVSRLIADALKSADLETKAGKLLQAWRTVGVAAPRVLLVGMGDGSARRSWPQWPPSRPHPSSA